MLTIYSITYICNSNTSGVLKKIIHQGKKKIGITIFFAEWKKKWTADIQMDFSLAKQGHIGPLVTITTMDSSPYLPHGAG